MAINVVYGDAPGGGGLIANRLAANDRTAEADKDRAFSQVQREYDRQFQEEQANKDRRQNALFKGLDLGLTAAFGLPGAIEGFRNLAGPTARQVQVAAQEGQLGVDIARTGASMAASALAADRKTAQLSESAAVGNSRMLANVSADADKQLFSRISQGDSEALDEALRTGKATYTPSVAKARRGWEDQRAKIMADSTNYTPAAKKAAIATIDASLAQTQFAVQPNPGAAPDKGTQYHQEVYVDKDGRRVQKNQRDGTWRYLTHPEDEAKTKVWQKEQEARIDANNWSKQYDDAFQALSKVYAADDNRRLTSTVPTHDEVMAYVTRKRVAMQSLYADDGSPQLTNAPSVSPRSLFRQTSANPMPPPGPAAMATDQPPAETVPAPQADQGPAPPRGLFKASYDRRRSGDAPPRFSAEPNLAVNLKDYGRQFEDPTYKKADFQRSSSTSEPPRPPENLGERKYDPLELTSRGPTGGRYPKTATTDKRDASEGSEDTYIKAANSVPASHSSIKREVVDANSKSPGANIAKALGLKRIAMQSDGRSLLPVLVSKDQVAKYSASTKPGTQFIWIDGKTYETYKAE